MAVDTPHFNFPFRISPTGVDAVEQDTVEDVANCVIAIMATVIGSRDLAPTFGVPDLVFLNQPIGVHDLLISSQEPRAEIDATERFELADPLEDVVLMKVSTQTKKLVG
jgi:hypothetical protein